KAVQRTGAAVIDQFTVLLLRQPETVPAQIRNFCQWRVWSHDDGLELLDPRDTDNDSRLSQRFRPNGRHVAALAKLVGQAIVVVARADRVVLRRAHRVE